MARSASAMGMAMDTATAMDIMAAMAMVVATVVVMAAVTVISVGAINPTAPATPHSMAVHSTADMVTILMVVTMAATIKWE